VLHALVLGFEIMTNQDVLTAAELNSRMIAISQQVDDALTEYRTQTEQWVQADRASRLCKAQAFLTARGKTVAEKEALVEVACDQETFKAIRTDALRNAAREALRARQAQLSAAQSLAAALREELKFAGRSDEVYA
jgi:hypothetical protein